MKNFLLLSTFILASFTFSQAQEFANFELTGTHQGTGTFTNAALPDFSWQATGALAQEVQILDDEVFDDGNEFENTFGQADYAENLRIQVYPNGEGTAGKPVISKASLTLTFDETTPAGNWGFCVVDIDVENCLISAIDEDDNEVSVDEIDSWLIELFDANVIDYGVNIPKWDASHAALLGSDTPDDYVVYDSLVIGGLYDSEAAAAFFIPDIPLKSLTIVYENLQEIYFTSFHFYIASSLATDVAESEEVNVVVYPNPAVDRFGVRGLRFPARTANAVQSGGGVGGATIALYDLNGRKLLEKHIPKGAETAEIDVSGLKNGLYFCRISTKEYSVTKKLIIQK